MEVIDMRTYKKIAMLVITVCVMGCLSGCVSESEETQYTDELKSQISDMYGYPNVTTFFEYSQLKEIYELRDNPDLVCYWYTYNQMTGLWVYQGECIGYGIPYGASITAPESYQRINGVGWESLPLAEPNGLYTDGLSTSATWILSIGSDGEIKPRYVEQEIMVSPEKLDKSMCQ